MPGDQEPQMSVKELAEQTVNARVQAAQFEREHRQQDACHMVARYRGLLKQVAVHQKLLTTHGLFIGDMIVERLRTLGLTNQNTVKQVESDLIRCGIDTKIIV